MESTWSRSWGGEGVEDKAGQWGGGETVDTARLMQTIQLLDMGLVAGEEWRQVFWVSESKGRRLGKRTDGKITSQDGQTIQVVRRLANSSRKVHRPFQDVYPRNG